MSHVKRNGLLTLGLMVHLRCVLETYPPRQESSSLHSIPAIPYDRFEHHIANAAIRPNVSNPLRLTWLIVSLRAAEDSVLLFGNPTLYAQPLHRRFLWPIHGEDRQFGAGLAASHCLRQRVVGRYA